MTEEQIIRTYLYPCFPNKGKSQKVERLLTEYRKTAQDIAKLQWREFFSNGKFNKYLNIKALHSALSERRKQTCQWQVVGVLNGYLANIQDEFERIVYHYYPQSQSYGWQAGYQGNTLDRRICA